MTVVLKLTGDPVAVVRARASGKPLADTEQDAIERDLRHQQDTLTPAIGAHGAQVLSGFQHAINGIKVRGTAAQIAALADLPGVVAIKPVTRYRLDNATSVPFIGAPLVWQGTPGFHGEHIKVAVIDSGIDYTHANMGGLGTVAAFTAAKATSTQPADPRFFGPAAPKVKGGIDLVGDNYDPSQSDAAHAARPDPNPLDCAGHGSHVAGTVAGFGVTAKGARYAGPYDASTPGLSFLIGPGVAPLADLYAVRVSGCLGAGATDVVIDAIEWSVKHRMQVINISLGVAYGSEDSAEAEASENAVEAGVVVVASVGNDGPSPYIQGHPGSGDKVISVAAIESGSNLSGAKLVLNTGATVLAQISNGAPITDAIKLPIIVLRGADFSVSLGCDDSEYGGVAGKLVVTMRGTCSMADRARLGAQHGARAVAMINNEEGYPPVVGDIAGVTIPFFGVRGGSAPDGLDLSVASSATLSHLLIPNPAFRTTPTFSSGGPREGDGFLKPDLSAPGVSIVSTGMGTGNAGVLMSGTSMSAPHVAGVAALAIQAHPAWHATRITTAIVNTADAAQLLNWTARLNGAGVVQALPATRTDVVAVGEREAPSLNFGVRQFERDFEGEHDIRIDNLGSRSATFSVSVVPSAGTVAHAIQLSSRTVSVAAGRSAKLRVFLRVPVGSVGDASQFRDVAGLITLKPIGGSDNHGVALHVPYYLVPRARSLVDSDLVQLQAFGVWGRMKPFPVSPVVRVRNDSGKVPGAADFYAWGLAGRRKALGSINLRAVGVQSLDIDVGKALVFAVNTFRPWSSAATDVFEILVDVNGDGVADYEVVAIDLGLLTTGAHTGEVASAVVDLATNLVLVRFMAVAPTDGNTLQLPFLAGDLGISPANPRFSYSVRSSDLLTGAVDQIPTSAKFNAFDNAISTGAFVNVGPRRRASVPLSVDPLEFAVTPPLGVMVVSLDNVWQGDEGQAQLLRFDPRPPKWPFWPYDEPGHGR